MAERTVAIRLQAITADYQAKMAQAAGTTNKFAADVTATGAKTQAFGQRMSSTGLALTKTLTPAFGAIALGLGKVAQEWNKGTDAIRVGTGATGKALENLTDSMKNVAGKVTQPLGEVGDVMADIATRTNLTGPPLERLTKQVLDLSRITGTDAKASVASLTRLFGDWSVSTEKQSATLDKLYRVSQLSGAGVDTLAQQMVQFGSPLRQLGLDFDTTASMFARFEKEGVNIQTAMPGLRMALKNFAAAGREPAPALLETIEAIKNASSTAKANTLAFEVFGTRAGPDLAAAIREGRFDLGEYIDVMQNGRDTITKAAQDTSHLTDMVARFRNRITAALGPVAEFGAVLAGGVAAIGPFLLGLGTLITALGKSATAMRLLNVVMAATPWIAGATAGIGALAAMFLVARSNAEKFRAEVEGMKTSLLEGTKSLGELEAAVRHSGDALDEEGKAVESSAAAHSDWTFTVGAGAKAAQVLTREQKQLDLATRELRDQLLKQLEQLSKLPGALTKAEKAVIRNVIESGNYSTALRIMTENEEDARAAIIRKGEKMERNTHETERLMWATERYTDSLKSEEQQHKELIKELERQDQKMIEMIKTITRIEEKSPVKTKFETPGLAEALADANDFAGVLRALRQHTNVRVNVAFTGERGDGPGAASGGLAAAWANQAIAAVPGPQYITSGYRTPAENARVGGAPNSYHMDASNPAQDIGGSNLDAVYNFLRKFPTRELLWKVPGHYDHVHVADEGGWFQGPGLVAMGQGKEYFASGLMTPASPIAGPPIDYDRLGKAIAEHVGPKAQLVFNGNVYGMPDFQRAVMRAVEAEVSRASSRA
jgi:phage-related minor tail protein